MTLFRSLAIGALVLAALPLHAPAQEIDSFALFSSSDQPVLQSGAGGGLTVSFGAADWLRFGGGVVQYRSLSERDGLVCTRIQPLPWGCSQQQVEEQITVRSVRLSLMPHLDLTRAIRAKGAVGLSISELNGESTGATANQFTNLYVPPSAQLGGYLRLDLIWSPAPRVPLGVWMAGGSHWVNLEGCRTQGNYHAPLCGVERFTEVLAGITYRIGF
jgi:hypothetical protein